MAASPFLSGVNCIAALMRLQDVGALVESPLGAAHEELSNSHREIKLRKTSDQIEESHANPGHEVSYRANRKDCLSCEMHLRHLGRCQFNFCPFCVTRSKNCAISRLRKSTSAGNAP